MDRVYIASLATANTCVATYLRWEGKAKSKGVSSKKENGWESPPMFIRGKHYKNQKEGLQILKIRVRELFTHGEGISTPRACHKGRQPLFECAKHDFKIVYFPFLYFFFGSTRVFSLLLHILRCDEEFRPT